MKSNIVKIAWLGLVAAALTLVPNVNFAQDAATNAPAATPKKHPLPFQGKVVAVDTSANTLTVGKQTFTITPTTKFENMTNTTATVTLADLTVGEVVTGSYKKTAEGTLDAYSVHIGVKLKHHKKKPTTDSSTTSTAPAASN